MTRFSFLAGSPAWIRKSIRRRLVFWSFVFWAVAVTIFSVSFLVVAQNELQSQAKDRNVQLASVVSRSVNSQMGTIFSDARTFALHLQLTDPSLGAQAAAVLSLRLSAPDRYLAAYYYTDHSAPVFSLTENLDGLLAIKDPSAIITREQNAVGKDVSAAAASAWSSGYFVSDVSFTALDRTPVIYVGEIFSFQGGDTHCVVLEVSLQDIWSRVNLITVGQSGYTYVVSSSGVIIAHPDPSKVGQTVDAALSGVVAGHEGAVQYSLAPGRKVLAAFSPVGGQTSWNIVMVQDMSEINGVILRSGLIIIAILAVLGIAGTAGILVLIGNFVRPIVALTETTESIRHAGALKKTGLSGAPDEIGQLGASFDQMVDRLQDTEGKLATAVTDERNRLARDLHDAVSQTLFSASIIAEVLPKLWEKNPDEGRRRLEEIRQLTRGALAEMRTLLFELRPSALADADTSHLMHQLVESLSGRLRIPVDVQIDKDCPLPPDVKVAFYRIAQEALNNVIKHSSATAAKVVMNCRPSGVFLSINDNGAGFDPATGRPGSLGVGIMHDRAAEIGASLIVESKVGAGSTVTVTWSPPEEPGDGRQNDTCPAGG